MYRTIIVDDEEKARDRLMDLLIKHESEIKIIGVAVDGLDAFEKISRLAPDLIFLDIKMPGMNAFELIKELNQIPKIIFTTAYDQYALDAFKTNSIEYLLKPIQQEDIDRAVSKLHSLSPDFDHVKNLYHYLESKLDTDYITRISSKFGDSIHLIDVSKIMYFQSKDKYTNVYTSDACYLIEPPLVTLESKLDPKQFTRIHRGTIINFTYIDKIQKEFDGRLEITMRDERGTRLLASRSYAQKIKAL